MNAKAQKIITTHNRASGFPYLIKITHETPESKRDYFFANSSENITYNGDIYNAAIFSIQPPEKDGSKIGNAALTISAIDQFWVQKIRETQMPALLQFIAVIVNSELGSGIESLEENCFTLRAANWDEASISWEMSFDERMGYIATTAKCTPQISPGCV